MNLERTDGGLLVPQGAYEESVARALKDHDPLLRLVPQDSDHFGRRVYKVFRYAGSERSAEFILFWGDPTNNVAYPLSYAIVDEVKRHDRGERGFSAEDSDTINARLLEESRRKSREEGQALAEEHADRMTGKKKTVLHTSKNLQLSRIRHRRSFDP